MKATAVRPVKMNDRAVQAIVRKYIESLERRHRADGQADTKLEERRK